MGGAAFIEQANAPRIARRDLGKEFKHIPYPVQQVARHGFSMVLMRLHYWLARGCLLAGTSCRRRHILCSHLGIPRNHGLLSACHDRDEGYRSGCIGFVLSAATPFVKSAIVG